MAGIDLTELGVGASAYIFTNSEDFLPEYTFTVMERGEQPECTMRQLVTYTNLQTADGTPPPPELRDAIGPISVRLEGCVDLEFEDDSQVTDDQLDELKLSLPTPEGFLRAGSYLVISSINGGGSGSRSVLVPKIDRVGIKDPLAAMSRLDVLV